MRRVPFEAPEEGGRACFGGFRPAKHGEELRALARGAPLLDRKRICGWGNSRAIGAGGDKYGEGRVKTLPTLRTHVPLPSETVGIIHSTVGLRSVFLYVAQPRWNPCYMSY